MTSQLLASLGGGLASRCCCVAAARAGLRPCRAASAGWIVTAAISTTARTVKTPLRMPVSAESALVKDNRAAAPRIFSLPACFKSASQDRLARPLETPVENKHDARRTRLLKDRPWRRYPMLQRALPVTHPPMPRRQTSGARRPLTARRLYRAFTVRALLMLRRLGEFFAAGGPLS